MDKMLEILREIHPEVDYESCTTLIDDGILDSFDIVTIVGEINDKFDVAVPPEEIQPENFNSAQSLYAMVQRLLEE